jgi:hypothetical protein
MNALPTGDGFVPLVSNVPLTVAKKGVVKLTTAKKMSEA